MLQILKKIKKIKMAHCAFLTIIMDMDINVNVNVNVNGNIVFTTDR